MGEAIVRSDPLETSPADYEERYSLTGSLFLLVLCGFAVITFLIWAFVRGIAQQPAPLRDLVSQPGFWGFVATTATGVGMFGGYCVGWLVVALTGQVALRVDRHGVLLGPVPFPPKRSVLVPWSSIDEIMTFKRDATAYSALKPLIGVRLRADAPRPSEVPRPGTMRHRLRVWNNILEAVAPDLERMMRGWELDTIALQRSVWRYGPHVRIFHLR
jgi:hypothetical protein